MVRHKIRYKFRIGEKVVFCGERYYIVDHYIWPTQTYCHEPAYRISIGSCGFEQLNVAEEDLEKYKGSLLENEDFARVQAEIWRQENPRIFKDEDGEYCKVCLPPVGLGVSVGTWSKKLTRKEVCNFRNYLRKKRRT